MVSGITGPYPASETDQPRSSLESAQSASWSGSYYPGRQLRLPMPSGYLFFLFIPRPGGWGRGSGTLHEPWGAGGKLPCREALGAPRSQRPAWPSFSGIVTEARMPAASHRGLLRPAMGRMFSGPCAAPRPPRGQPPASRGPNCNATEGALPARKILCGQLGPGGRKGAEPPTRARPRTVEGWGIWSMRAAVPYGL